MRLYWEIAKREFQRQLAYRTANLAGVVTNAFFGYIRAAIMVAAYAQALVQAQVIAGYDQQDAVTFIWVTQALIMVVVLWAWWEVETTIRTGQVVSDLSKPFSYLGFWLARDFGRAAYHLLSRCLPILIVGQLTYGLRWPSGPLPWLAFFASLALAVAVSFAWRFIVNLSAFWTTDARGAGQLLQTVVLFMSGFVIPVRFFPDGLRQVALALPFAGIIQTPVDLFLERVTGPAALGSLALQAFWTLAMLGLAQIVTQFATRKVVIQGG